MLDIILFNDVIWTLVYENEIFVDRLYVFKLYFLKGSEYFENIIFVVYFTCINISPYFPNFQPK